MPRNDTPLVPLTVTSLEEIEVILSNDLSAKIVASDRPGYIAVEVTSEVEAEVSYEDTDSVGTPGKAGYESKTFRQESLHTKVFSQIVYIPIGEAQAACNTVYYNTLKPTVTEIKPAPLGLDRASAIFADIAKEFTRRQEERLFHKPNAMIVSPPRYGKNAFFETLTAPIDGVIRWDQASYDGPVDVSDCQIRYIGGTAPLPHQLGSFVGATAIGSEQLEQIRAADCHL